MNWLLLALAGLLEIGWVYALKQSDNFADLRYAGLAVILLVLSMACLSLSLRSIPIGTACTTPHRPSVSVVFLPMISAGRGNACRHFSVCVAPAGGFTPAGERREFDKDQCRGISIRYYDHINPGQDHADGNPSNLVEN